MAIKLIIPIECSENTCNYSIFNICRFLARNTGAPFNHYCLLFNAELKSEFYRWENIAYKEFQRCKECKECPIYGYQEQKRRHQEEKEDEAEYERMMEEEMLKEKKNA